MTICKTTRDLENLENHKKTWSNCTKCLLCKSRSKIVFSRGTIPSDIVFVGEAPGLSEDDIGIPFIGEAGKWFDRLVLDALKLTEAEIGQTFDFSWSVTNLVACRPPDNRVPRGEEIAACYPRLAEYIRIARPTAIVSLGKTAVTSLEGVGVPPRLSLVHPSFLARTNSVTLLEITSLKLSELITEIVGERIS